MKSDMRVNWQDDLSSLVLEKAAVWQGDPYSLLDGFILFAWALIYCALEK